MSEFAYGREFTNEAMHQLNGVIAGREDAKIAAITGMVAGVNTVFSGGTGRGKTELMQALPRLVHDIYPENVANVPIMNDLTGMQLIGGSASIEKTTVSPDGTSTTERTLTQVPGIVKPDTQVINIDEFNRMPPQAMNSLVDALEHRRVTTLDGARELPSLEYVLAGMNARESYESTRPVAHALISRFAIGAIFNRGTIEQRTDRLAAIQAIRPGKVEPITDVNALHAMRNAADHKAIPASLDDKIARMTIDASDRLWEIAKLDDGEERMFSQVRRIARVLTVLANEQSVNEVAVNNAMAMVVSARIGMADADAVNTGPATVKQILSANQA